MPRPSPASRQSAQACASRTSSWSSILPGHKQPGLLRTTLSKQTVRKTQTPPLLCIVQARQNSPSAAGLSRAREKNRPACAKHPKLGAFVSAGRRKSRLRAPQLGSQTVRRPPRQSREGASECLPSVISHVIPWRPLQTLNLRRCNYNVCGRSPKLTAGNYVRFLSGSGSGPAAARGPCASEISRVKPPSPLLARMCLGLKPPSPLRGRKGCLWCVFRLQW